MNAPEAMPLGIVHDLPFDAYLAIDALSSTGLRTLARSPWHYRNRIESAQTRPMLRGTLAHCAVLEPDAMTQRFLVLPEDAPRKPTRAQWSAKNPSPDSRAAMAWWTQFHDSAAGRDLVTHDEYNVCQQQLAALCANHQIADMLRVGRGEVSIFWIDDATGIYCKARPDWLRLTDKASPLDLKTCADESPGGFGRAAARLRYDLQAAHYTAGIKAVTALPVDDFLFAAVTNNQPVLAVPYVLTDEIRDQGNAERRELMEKLAWCRRENEWPAYGAGIQLLDFPAYAKHSGEVEVEWSES
jgi:hypothetical protein